LGPWDERTEGVRPGPGGPQGGTQFQECQGNRQRFCGIPQRRQNRGHNTHSAHQRWFAGDARKGEGGEGGKGLGVATRRTVSRAGDLGEGGTQGIKRRQKRTHIYGRSGINRFATDKEGCNLWGVSREKERTIPGGRPERKGDIGRKYTPPVQGAVRSKHWPLTADRSSRSWGSARRCRIFTGNQGHPKHGRGS
jgi:hypothetical protein